MLRKVVGDNLNRIRKEMRFSQHAVAKKSNLEQKDISKIENYVENVGLDKLDQICKGLGIYPYLLFIEGDEISDKNLLELKCFLKGVVCLLYHYYLIMSQIHSKDISPKPYTSYGIGVLNNCVPCIEDISTDKAFVESLIELCNVYQLDPIHLKEFVEDSLLKM